MNDRHDSFEDALRDSLRHTPWLAVSVAFHAALLLVLAQFPWSVARDAPREVIIIGTAPPPVDPIDPPEPPEPPEPRKIEPLEPIDLPEVTETPMEHDVANEEFSPDLSPINAPFDSNRWNADLGVGSNAGGPPGGGSGRFARHRAGPTASQRAVDDALTWLARHQDPRGFWSAEGFADMCRTNRCDGEGDRMHDVGVTGLSLLAFLGAGQTVHHGKHKQVVRRGLKYLLGAQDPESGCVGELNSHQAFLYDHALATLALTEAYGLSSWPMLKDPAQRAVNFVHAARNPYKAWRYAYPPNGENDVSITGWMVLCLKSARDFGLRVDEAAFDGARLYLDELTDENTWRAGYMTKGSYSAREPGMGERWPEQKTEALTAVAMLCRVFLGEDVERSPALRGGADLLRKQLPLWDESEGTIDYYYWYYGSYAMWQMGGRDWDVWQSKMLDAVVKTQRHDGDEQGSWDPQFDPWGHRGGRVYSTAIMALCLEVYYRYDRIMGGR